ncbi:MAG: hypothetical protein FWF90_02140 [Promicromonosporaceae bacterium]|nr:hypothetical protein [Promicromonosporaceae bacterium]
MSDASATTERSPREPFADVPLRELVRDVTAAAALLVGLALPWTATSRGSDRIEIVLATVVALLGVALPYARRASLAPAWSANESLTRLVAAAPLVVVAVIHLIADVIPGGAHGVGAGLGLGLAGALLGAAITWPRTATVVAGILALGAVAAPVLAATGGDVSGWGLVAVVLTALLVLGLLWLTVVRFERGDQAAGVLLVGVGIVLALGAALVGGNARAPWIESVHGAEFGLVLLPVLAAVVAPAVVQQTVLADAQPRLWSATASHAFEVGLLVAGYVVLAAVVGLASTGASVQGVLRLVLGLIIVGVAFFARRALLRDLVSGHATAVVGAFVVLVLGLVLLAVRADGTTAAHPLDVLLTFGVPAIVLSVLLVPRSVRELRDQLAAQPETAAAGVPAVQTTYTEAAYPQAAPSGPVYGAAPTTQVAAPTQYVPAEAPADATQILAPIGQVEEPPTNGQAPGGGATQVLPPVADVPGSRWTVAQALDPATPLADLAVIVQEAPHLRPMVAANPSTYPALLDWLGALGDPDVDAALRTRS